MKIKSLLFGLLAVICLASCADQPTTKKTDIPVEVMQLKEVQKFDTVLTINTEKATYLFDAKTNNYVGTIAKTKDEETPILVGMFLGALFLLLIIAMVAGALD